MITNLKDNKFTQKIASGAAAIGVLAGVGLAGAPAQAGTFTLRQSGTDNGALCNTDITAPSTTCVLDTEWGAGGPEPIWSTFPNLGSTNLNPPGSNPGIHGVRGVDGWDNPTIGFNLGSGFSSATIQIEYFGSGTATQTNNFFWSTSTGDSPFGAHNGGNDGCADPNNFATLCTGFPNPVIRTVTSSGKLDLSFLAGTSPVTNIPNGTPYVDPPGAPHYFATIDGTWNTAEGEVLYLGLSDRPGATGDDDAADYVVKLSVVEQTPITRVPEPGTVLGLLAVGGLGAFMKRKRQG